MYNREKNTEYFRKYREKNRERTRLYWRKYHKEWRRKYGQESVIRWQKAHQVEMRAHYILRRAKDRGEITKKPCEVCGATNSVAHHKDYSKPLDVIWLCRLHHRHAHLGVVSI